MSHASQIAAILEDVTANSKIWFRVSTVEVNPNRLAEVGKLIRQGGISVDIDPTDGKGGYWNRDNRLTMPDIGTDRILRRGLIIHEGVHAINDIYRVSVCDIDDECAAYIAQAAYILSNDFQETWKGDLDKDGLPYAALTLAEQVVGGATLVESLMPDEYQKLRTKVAGEYGLSRRDWTFYEGIGTYGQEWVRVRSAPESKKDSGKKDSGKKAGSKGKSAKGGAFNRDS